MKSIKKGVCSELNDWIDKTDLDSVYLFGSIIHKDGIQFDLQESDIDTVSPFSKNANYLSRWNTVKNCSESASHLNLQLLRIFNRKDASQPIVSIVPVSSFELERGIHKDKSPQFFSHNEFLNVKTQGIGSVGNEYKPLSAELEGALDSVREAQRFRNLFLSISPSGQRFVSDYNGPDVMPKKLARCAAQVRWACEKETKSDQRYDLNEGIVYILQLLTSRRNEDTSVDDLLQRIIIRMGGRGKSGPLTPIDQLLLWEILVEDTFGLFPKCLASPKPKGQIPISEKTKQEVLARAGYRCSFPGCRVPLGIDGIGEIAHISRATIRGIRHDPNITIENENSTDNLIALCPTHHRLIDSNPDEYSTTTLRSWNQVLADDIIQQFTSKNLFTIVKLITEILP